MRFVGRGHPAVRATHAKTLELSPDPDITARATCVVAVGSEADPVAPMAGRVRIRVAAGGERFTLEADANPSWDPSGPAVIRRSPLRRPGTFATGATASAADLPRPLVAALQDPDALVTVDVTAVPDDRRTLVLYAADPALAAPVAGLRAEHQRAARVVAQDDGARHLLTTLDEPPDGTGHRTLVVATADLPRPPDATAGHRVEVVGLNARLATAAASPSGGPVVLAEPGADVRRSLRETPAAARLVVVVPAAALDELLGQARAIRGSSACVVAQEYVHPVRVESGATPELAGSADVAVCFDAAPPDEAFDPAVRAAVDALLADGVATRTAAKALVALTGWDRRRAYDAIVAWPRR
ncbi:DUF371 domain-containing protein [uncultured Jatrophihabitans sp.]|uniref:DUF371 domain-containing protein n=1 Tax=uncultured Jatrophihabitans sp. TaxID=1610747 RepID=UPI0035CC1143